MMLIKYLKKYRFELNINKSQLSKRVSAHKELLTKEGFEYKTKNINDLFNLEIVYQAIDNKNKIDEAYDNFIGKNFDALEYINYDERRKMFNHDLEAVIKDMVSFKDKESGIQIYIPYLEVFVNERIINDYQVLRLKQHEIYLKEYPRNVSNLTKLYGINPYASHFSSLEALGQDDLYYYFYHQEFKCVYIFKKDDCSLYDELCLVDKYSSIEPSIDLVKEMVKFYLMNDDDLLFVEELHSNNFIGEKTYKKLKKKLG